MNELILEYGKMKETMHSVQRVTLVHLKFEGIYPFIDVNGRTGRLLLNLELMQYGYPSINVKFNDRSKYYDCFTAYHHSNGNPEAVVFMIAEYVKETLGSFRGSIC